MDKDLFKGRHNFVCGMTGSGKTYMALKILDAAPEAAFFYNPQETKTNFCKVDGRYTCGEIIRALRAGEKLDYIPERNLKTSKNELNYIIQSIFSMDKLRDKPFYFCIDECHLVAKQGANNEYINMIPTRGRIFGFQGVFIAQRPALVDKTILTQSEQHIIFTTEYEQQYFKTKGVDAAEVQALLGDFDKNPHNFCIYKTGKLSGPYKV